MRVPPDGSVDSTIVGVKITYTNTDTAGKKSSEQTVKAWMPAYEECDGKWF
jgi:hypothetical protein